METPLLVPLCWAVQQLGSCCTCLSPPSRSRSQVWEDFRGIFLSALAGMFQETCLCIAPGPGAAVLCTVSLVRGEGQQGAHLA